MESIRCDDVYNTCHEIFHKSKQKYKIKSISQTVYISTAVSSNKYVIGENSYTSFRLHFIVTREREI